MARLGIVDKAVRAIGLLRLRLFIQIGPKVTAAEAFRSRDEALM